MSAMTTIRRTVGVACLSTLLAVGTALSAAAVVDDGPPEEPEGGISDSDIRSSVTVFDTDAVRVFDPDGHVRSLGDDVESSSDQTVISLSTDLLFTPNNWELPASAPDRIEDLVEDVPDGATVEVTGHTDSVPTGEDFDNAELSENRAEAVAEVLADKRPDLDLEVSGVGDSDPAVAEDEEDPSTFAANRRVEISYEG